jgi:hypothetical protein
VITLPVTVPEGEDVNTTVPGSNPAGRLSVNVTAVAALPVTFNVNVYVIRSPAFGAVADTVLLKVITDAGVGVYVTVAV